MPPARRGSTLDLMTQHPASLDESRMPAHAVRSRFIGLYALKPWYARRLRGLTDRLDALGMTPNQLSFCGVLFGGAAGVCVAALPFGAVTGLVVGILLAARLACANMDGSLARRRPRAAFGGVVNELGDRGADLAMLVGLAAHLGWASAGAVMFAATLPSWVSSVIAGQGGQRLNSGPVGKTERCLLMVAAATTGWFGPVAGALVVGGIATALVRLHVGRAQLLEGGAR